MFRSRFVWALRDKSFHEHGVPAAVCKPKIFCSLSFDTAICYKCSCDSVNSAMLLNLASSPIITVRLSTAITAG